MYFISKISHKQYGTGNLYKNVIFVKHIYLLSMFVTSCLFGLFWFDAIVLRGRINDTTSLTRTPDINQHSRYQSFSPARRRSHNSAKRYRRAKLDINGTTRSTYITGTATPWSSFGVLLWFLVIIIVFQYWVGCSQIARFLFCWNSTVDVNNSIRISCSCYYGIFPLCQCLS